MEMETVKNADNKTVCRADAETMTVEIVRRGRRTVIRFLGDGKMRISNN